MKTKIFARIAYHDIFDDPLSIPKTVSKIDPYSSLEFLAGINKYEYNLRTKPDSEIKFILNDWLQYSSKKFKQKIFAAYRKIASKRNGKLDFSSITIINTASTLRVMEILLSKTESSIQNTNEKSEMEDLFKLYLLVNDEFTKRENRIFEKWFSKGDKLSEIRMHLFLGMNLVEVNNGTLSKHFTAGLWKFLEFEKWFRQIPQYHTLTLDYLKLIGLDNWYDYFHDVMRINTIAAGHYKFSSEDYPYLTSIADFFSQRCEVSYSWNELLHIRKNPLLKISSTEFIFLHLGFLVDKFFSGIYHDLIQLSKEKNIPRFHQDYSKNFIEDRLLKNALKICFDNNYLHFSEKDIKNRSTKNVENLGIPDYYVRNGNKVMLFECKNSFLSNLNKIPLDFDKMETDVKNKFYQTDHRKKAIVQLLDYIKNSESGKYRFFDRIKKIPNIRYCPIIVVTDYTLTFIGITQLLNEFFSSEKESLNLSLKKRIGPVTIIHIDDFLYYGSDIKKLFQIIIHYHDFTKKQKGVDSMISFSCFLDTEYIKRKPIREKDIRHILKNSLLPTE